MSIASEITRLSSAKAALKDAIVAKGVEVADSLKLDGYAEKIAAIPTGGDEFGNGLPIGCPRIDKVEIATDEDEVYVVYCNYGDEPITVYSYLNTENNVSDSVEQREVIVNNDGSVEETSNYTVGRTIGLTLNGAGYHVVRYRCPTKGRRFSYLTYSHDGKNDGFAIASKGVLSNNTSNVLYCETYGHYDGTDVNFFVKASSFAWVWKRHNPNGVLPYATFNQLNSLIELTIRGKCAKDALRYANINNLRFLDVSEVDFSDCEYPLDFGAYISVVKMPLDSNKGMRISHTISSAFLTHTSLLSIINSLYDHASAGTGQTPTLTLGSKNLAKLTDAEKSVATNKGWILA